MTDLARAADLFRRGLDEQVVPIAEALTRHQPDLGQAWLLLGSSLKRLQRFAEALPAMQRATELLPGRPELHSNLGTTYYRLGLESEAELCYRAALRLQSGHTDSLFNLGRLQTRQSRFAESAATFAALVAVNAGDGEAHAELGIAFAGLERWLDAEQSCRRAIALGHRDGVVFDHLGRSLLEQGRPEAALAIQQEGLAAAPDSVSLLRNFLFTRNHVPDLGPAALPAEAARLGALLAGAVGKTRSSWSCEPEPRTLRIGLVSGDLRRHPVASFLAGFLRPAADHGLAFHAYAASPREDEITHRMRQDCAGWRCIADQSAAEAAECIANDGIHVLFDLSGHTSNSRLDVFALAPAPVQVTWLGVPATTGLRQIDYILSDRHASAPGDEAWFSERFWPLDESWFCYSPLEAPPEVSPLPALTNGHVTFGSFNSMTKINDRVIHTWAGVLRAVPGSRLLMRNWQLCDAAMAQQLASRFAAHGIAPDRLQFEGPILSLASHLAQYHRVDMALDSFPYMGGTTSTEALYMGVPFVSLRGDGRMLRLGESLLRHAGLPEWIAPDEESYVQNAASFASDLKSLSALRTGLRARMQATSFFDGARFAGQFAAAAWGMWKRARAGDNLHARH